MKVKEAWFVIVLVLLLYALYSLVIRAGVPTPAPPLYNFKNMVSKTVIAILAAAGIIIYLNFAKND